MSEASLLASMTPEQLAQTPAGMPPPGVVPNLLHPHSDNYILISIGTVLVAIMLLFSGIRFYMKVFVRRKVMADDWACLAAVIGTLWYYAICIHAVTKAQFGTHMWDISVAHTMSNDFLIAAFFSNWVTGLVWACAKSAFFLMYLQIFNPYVWLRMACYFGLALNWLFYLAVIAASIYYQAPNPGQTWQEGFLNRRYDRAFNMTIPIAAGSLFLDLYIFLLPMIAVSKLQLSGSKKFGVLAVFATGLIACVASSLSIVFKHKLNGHLNDYTYWIMPVLLTALIEMCVGISCSSMPAAAGFFKHAPGSSSTFSAIFRSFRSLTSRGSSRGTSRGTAKETKNTNDSWKSKESQVSKGYLNLHDNDSRNNNELSDMSSARSLV